MITCVRVLEMIDNRFDRVFNSLSALLFTLAQIIKRGLYLVFLDTKEKMLILLWRLLLLLHQLKCQLIVNSIYNIVSDTVAFKRVRPPTRKLHYLSLFKLTTATRVVFSVLIFEAQQRVVWSLLQLHQKLEKRYGKYRLIYTALDNAQQSLHHNHIRDMLM